MNTTELIEIAKECCFSRQVVGDETALITFRSEQLQQLAQRIEAPHKQRIAELEKDCEILQTNLDAALMQVKQLREALHNAQEDADIGRFFLRHATEWIRKPYISDYEDEPPYAVMGLRLPYDTDLSSVGMRRHAITQARKALEQTK